MWLSSFSFSYLWELIVFCDYFLKFNYKSKMHEQLNEQNQNKCLFPFKTNFLSWKIIYLFIY